MENPQQIVNQKISCEICERCFSSNGKKNRHIKTIHGNEKIFECNVCHKFFGYKQALTIHIENNHENQQHNCKF